MRPHAFVDPIVIGDAYVPMLRSFIFAHPSVAPRSAVYGCVFVTGIVPPENIQLIVFEERRYQYVAYVVTVVPDTQFAYTMSVTVIVSQVTKFIGPWITLGFVHMQFFARVTMCE